MTKDILFFKRENKDHWPVVKNTLHHLIRKWSSGNKDFQIVLEELEHKRSNTQLATYWRLIDVVRRWMNEEDGGYIYDKEQVSDYFLHEIGLGKVKDGRVLVRSLSSSGSITTEEMNKLIECVLEFGARHGIEGCEIRN